jgi:hypothetical protein
VSGDRRPACGVRGRGSVGLDASPGLQAAYADSMLLQLDLDGLAVQEWAER